jgi:hypothetical protein
MQGDIFLCQRSNPLILLTRDWSARLVLLLLLLLVSRYYSGTSAA